MNHNSEYQHIIGKKLCALRLEKNYSQHAVANDLGISDGTLSKIEHGTYKLSIEMITNLANYYDKPVSYFLPPL